jgi:hypothetical protein
MNFINLGLHLNPLTAEGLRGKTLRTAEGVSLWISLRLFCELCVKKMIGR